MRIALLFLALAASASAQRPNVVLVYVDDLDLQSMERLGGLAEVTRGAGLDFRNGYIPNSICGPSRGALLSGTNTHTNGFLFNGKSYYLDWREAGWEDRSFPVRLREAGYYTAHIGKPTNGWPGRDDFYAPPGWDRFSAVVGDSTLYTDFETFEDIEGQEVMTSYVGTGVYRTDLEADLAVASVRRAVERDQPFFLYLSLYGPHAESIEDPPVAVAAPRHRGAFDGAFIPRDPDFNENDVSDKHDLIRGRSRISDAGFLDAFYRSRLEAMLSVEDAIRELRAELVALGVDDETYVFFVSDNGIMLGHHRVRFSKGFPYERSAHVPFYVSGPGIAPGAVSDALVSVVDVAPTVLDLAGAPIPGHYEGRSLAPLLRGEAVPWRQTLLLEGWRPDAAPYYRALVTAGGVKYADFPVSGESEIYDLRFDPYEVESRVDLVGADARARLRARLDSLASCTGAACAAVDARAAPRVDALAGRVSGDAVPGGSLSIGWDAIGVEGDLELALLVDGARQVIGRAPVVAGEAEVVVPPALAGDTVRVELRAAEGPAVWTGAALAIAATPVEASFRAFPNPTTGRLRLSLDVERRQRVRIDVFDALGRRLVRLYNEQVQANDRVRLDVDLRTLPAGAYVVRAWGRLFAFDRVISIVD
ncbi:sulfatase-like hydrolase/transferase [Rubrivirga sp. IMCC45206]|uniref:sulfatase-like hydrolase/transferase n=1 Tax=Rubrivirga sp. IMCC45206 TaxID=3391614 RepID=UPI00398FFCC3